MRPATLVRHTKRIKRRLEAFVRPVTRDRAGHVPASVNRTLTSGYSRVSRRRSYPFANNTCRACARRGLPHVLEGTCRRSTTLSAASDLIFYVIFFSKYFFIIRSPCPDRARVECRKVTNSSHYKRTP